MRIDFKRIILHNFMSFGDADLYFKDDGFIRVSGINENPQDNAGSNGSGKSSLWEAIVWAITGETIRGTKHVVNMYGEDGCFVDLEFYIDNKRYQIIRSKDHKVRKTSLQILINGDDVSGKGLRDSDKVLEKLLPDVTASLLGSVIVLGQGLPQKFTSNTPSGRKEVLEKLSQSDFMIEDLKQRVTSRKQTLQQELRTIEDAILSDTSSKKLLQTQSEQSALELERIDKSSIEANIQAQSSLVTELLEQLNHAEQLIESTVAEQSTCNSLRENILRQESADLEDYIVTYQSTSKPCADKASMLTAEVNTKQKLLL